MAYYIIDECINCGACAVECPTETIYEPGVNIGNNGEYFDSLSMDHFFIISDNCDECALFSKVRCIAVCPTDAIKHIFIKGV